MAKQHNRTKKMQQFLLAGCLMCCLQVLVHLGATAQAEKKAILWTADWSDDSRFFAVGGDDSLLRIYNGNNFMLEKTVRLKGMLRQVKWHPKKHRLAISTHNDQVQVFDLETATDTRLEGVVHGARAIGWNHSGELLSTAGNDGLVKIWNESGKLLRTITKEDNNSYFSLDWHPAKNLLAVAGDDLRIMDTSGQTLHVIRHRKEPFGILAVRWHPSGEFLSTADYGQDADGIPSLIQFWLPDGRLQKTLYGSKAEYRNLQWDRSGRYLASASDALRIWDKDGTLLYTGQAASLLWGIDWRADGEKIVSTSLSGLVQLWNKTAVLEKEK